MMKEWGVMDEVGAGWGRYDTKAEAEARRDGLLAMRDGEGGFVVVRVVP
jgi:hypothetical protein